MVQQEKIKRPLIHINKGSKISKIWFLGDPIITAHHREKYWFFFSRTIWILHEDFIFGFTCNNIEYKFVLKKDYLSDGASTPQLIWWIFPPLDIRWFAPALGGHDPFYGGRIFPRWFNDLFLRLGMKVKKAGKFAQWSFYIAVATWGWMAYLRQTPKSIQENRDMLEIWMN